MSDDRPESIQVKLRRLSSEAESLYAQFAALPAFKAARRADKRRRPGEMLSEQHVALICAEHALLRAKREFGSAVWFLRNEEAVK